MAKLKKIICEDGSITFLNEDLGEHYHSTSGASSEARQKHAAPASLKERCRDNNGYIRLLDFAFGLGYNSAAALEELWDNEDCQSVEITALENDPEIIGKISQINSDIKHYSVIKDFAAAFGRSSRLIRPFFYQYKKVVFKLYLDDAKLSVKFLKNNYYDAVFFDPFSSGRAPELWTQEIFDILHKKLKKGGALTTYSCARHFRKKLEKAGFSWRDIPPGFERRGPSTLAVKL